MIKLTNKVLQNAPIKGLKSKADRSIQFVAFPNIRTITVTTGKIKAAAIYHLIFTLKFGLKPSSFKLSFDNKMITIADNIGNTSHIPIPGVSPFVCTLRTESTITPIQPLAIMIPIKRIIFRIILFFILKSPHIFIF
ncbi:hypothetical protein SDC9_178934 [bioreactor metagenome]|uniref:Uncharacterized protein n=1 Tax=bioreactor metagenome TaxID=1076179 RepID=A0A645GYI6_9ZZZZ